MRSFVWSIYCWWVGSLVVLGFMSQPPTEQSAAECYWRVPLFRFGCNWRVSSRATSRGNVRNSNRKQCVTHRATNFTSLYQDHIYICDASCVAAEELRTWLLTVVLKHKVSLHFFSRTHDEDWHKTGQSFLACACMKDAFPQDGGSNGFSSYENNTFPLENNTFSTLSRILALAKESYHPSRYLSNVTH